MCGAGVTLKGISDSVSGTSRRSEQQASRMTRSQSSSTGIECRECAYAEDCARKQAATEVVDTLKSDGVNFGL